MTSRTTAFGALVVALASLTGVGCSSQTSAVFSELMDPAGAAASPAEDALQAQGDAEGAGTATWWPHPDGYAMTLPEGWSGLAMDDSKAGQLVDALSASDPGLADRIEAVLDATGSRVSAVAVDPSEGGPVAPVVVILAQPTRERQAHAVKSMVKEQIAGLPGLSAGPFRNDVTLPTAKGVRFEFSIDDPDLGALQVRAYLFRFGSDAYLVCFVAPAAGFDDAEAVFEAIAASLRFGV